MALDPVTAITNFAGQLIDIGSKFIPDEKNRLEFEAKILEYSSRSQEAVNATMQAEAKSEHWLQWSWRPLIGYTFAGVIINNYILFTYFSKWGMEAIDIPSELWASMLVVLGVASATRGVMNWQKVKGK